jgi:hypothetical protein
MLESWSSYKKATMGTMGQLELRLANSSVISFFLARYASTQTVEIVFQLAELLTVQQHFFIKT